MRRFWKILLCPALVAVMSGPVFGQTLELGRPEAPQLHDPTWPQQFANELEDELWRLSAVERNATGRERTVRSAMTRYRRIAATLMKSGDRSGVDGSRTIIAALTLAQGRNAVDSALLRIIDPGDQDISTALASIIQFNESPEWTIEEMTGLSPAELDLQLAIHLHPLAQAVATIENGPLQNHWIVEAPDSPAQFDDSIRDLRESLAAAPLTEETKADIATILDYLDRGGAFPEFRPRIERYRRLICDAIRLSQLLPQQSWLEERQRGAIESRLRDGVRVFLDKETRETGERSLLHLSQLFHVIDRLSKINAPRKERIDVRPIFRRIAGSLDDADETDVQPIDDERFARILEILDRMVTFRQADPIPFGGDLRITVRRLERIYRNTEDSVVEKIELVAHDDSALSDPAIASILSGHRQYLEDVSRVRRLPQWVELIRSINPDAAGPFEQAMQKTAAALLDPAQRVEAVRMLDRFEDQATFLESLPYEGELRHDVHDERILNVEARKQLLEMIEDARRDLAGAWSRLDDANEASKRLVLMSRLLRTIADIDIVIETGNDTSVLNPWSAWELPVGSPAGDENAVTERIRRAVETLLENRDDETSQLLDRITRDAVLMLLIGRIMNRISPSLEQLPSGATTVLSQVATPPRQNARLLSHRRDIAHICRYLLEASIADETGRPALAADCRRYVERLAEDALRNLDDHNAFRK